MRKVALAAILISYASLPGIARAAAPTLLTDGGVYATAATPSTLYIGGTFSRVSDSPIGDAASLNTSTGVANAQNPVNGGEVHAVVSDGGGGWYIGGAFTTVGGVARASVAHLKADGTLDTAFAPTVDGTVDSLLLSGSTLYIGGSFTTVDGTSHANVAAISTGDGSILGSFAASTNGAVNALALSGSNLYLGGVFDTVDATAGHAGLGAVNSGSGALDAAFAATTDLTSSNGERVSSLALSGTNLYVGGYFNHIDAVSRNALGAVDRTSGALVSGFAPGLANAAVSDLAVSGSTLYAVGALGAIGTRDLHGFGAFDTTTGALDPVPALTGLTGHDVFSISGIDSVAVSPSGSTIYLGGVFTTVDGATSYNLVAINASTGALSSWAPNPGGGVLAMALDSTGGTLEAVGDIRFLGGTPAEDLAAMNTSDGSIVQSFSSGLPKGTFLVDSLALSGNTLFVGGAMLSASHNLVAVNAQTGSLDPSFAPTMNGNPNALVVSGGTLYVGGAFSTLDGSSSQQDIGALNIANGSLVTSFNPPLTYAFGGLGVQALDLVGGRLYFGGDLIHFNGNNSTTLGAVNAGDGSPVTAFAPNVAGVVNALADSGGTLYAGGGFTAPAQVNNQGLVGVSLTDGSLVSAFAPQLHQGVASLLVAGGTLYAGVFLYQANGQAVKGVIALNPGDGTIAPLTTAAESGITTSSFKAQAVYSLAQSNGKVFAGGSFNELGGQVAGGLGLVGPACSNVAASTSPNTAVTVQLSCFDPGANALTYKLLSPPSHGTLGSISPSHTVSYTPMSTFTGTDSFTYDATGSDGTTNTATVTITVGSSVGPGQPVNTAAPMISGAAKARKLLSCSKGSWSNSPTGFAYQWSRDGTPIAGATASNYKVQTDDEGLTLRCTVTASNAAGSGSPATSRGITVAVPVVKGCPRATGRLSGVKLGLLRLGMTRSRARKAYRKSSSRRKKYQDFFCLTPNGVRAGYASPALLKTLPRGKRKRYRGKVIWASTAYAFYSLRGVRPGATIAAAGKLLTLTGPFHIGKNFLYLAPNGKSTGVMKVRGGIVQEIGIGNKSLTKGRRAQRTFLTSFS